MESEYESNYGMQGGNLWQLDMHREGVWKVVDQWMLITSRISAILSLIGIIVAIVKLFQPQCYHLQQGKEGYVMRPVRIKERLDNASATTSILDKAAAAAKKRCPKCKNEGKKFMGKMLRCPKCNKIWNPNK